MKTKTHFLFCTPELAVQQRVLDALAQLNHLKELHRIILGKQEFRDQSRLAKFCVHLFLLHLYLTITNFNSISSEDEFDYAAECTENYRKDYIGIIPKLREQCPGILFTLLSATARRSHMIDLSCEMMQNATAVPKLFSHNRALSDSLSFSVERKINAEQVQLISLLEYI